MEGQMFIPFLGLTTVEIVKLWQNNVPSLEQVRSADPEDPAIHQRLLDADYLGVGLALLVGGSMAILSKSMLPLMLSVASVWLYSKWYSMVLNAPNDPMF